MFFPDFKQIIKISKSILINNNQAFMEDRVGEKKNTLMSEKTKVNKADDLLRNCRMISEVSHVDCIAIKIEVLLNKQSLCTVLAGIFVYLFVYDVHSE